MKTFFRFTLIKFDSTAPLPLPLPRPRRLALLCFLLWIGIYPLSAATPGADDTGVLDVFSGSSPADHALWQQFDFKTDPRAELVQWELLLYRHSGTLAPDRYTLQCTYGLTGANVPGIASGKQLLERSGAWKITTGTASNPRAVVYELSGAVALYRIDPNLLHILDAGRNLMIGNSGWSYTLNRLAYSEKLIDPLLARNQPDRSYKITPKATGSGVFGIFEGRSPTQGIARISGIPVSAASTKTKWRLTLYRDPVTGQPAQYKAEGSLFLTGAHAGNWTILQGTRQDPQASVFKLAAADGIPDLYLLQADDNILYFLDADLSLLVGNADFSYTLNRIK